PDIFSPVNTCGKAGVAEVHWRFKAALAAADRVPPTEDFSRQRSWWRRSVRSWMLYRRPLMTWKWAKMAIALWDHSSRNPDKTARRPKSRGSPQSSASHSQHKRRNVAPCSAIDINIIVVDDSHSIGLIVKPGLVRR